MKQRRNKFMTNLSVYNIDTNSVVRAVADVRGLDFDPDKYREMVKELTGQEPRCTDKAAMYVAQYVVTDLVAGLSISVDRATEQAMTYLDANPWALVRNTAPTTYVRKHEFDAMGQPKKKKGAKKEMALAEWAQHKDKGWTRKQWIEHLVKTVGLSPAGASTYYHNLRTGLYK